ncbi:MAG: 6-pyruvoyl-tetrahydropterin synthase-related protein [Chloroflexota bacterium]
MNRKVSIEIGFAILLVSAAVLISLSRLWLADPASAYPWGSDTLGHLLKAEYLAEEIGKGHFYPEMFPYWYNGHQLFRQHPPLPYYILVGISLFSGDMISAGNWFVIIAALIGGLSFLLFSRYVGWVPAAIGGIFFTLAPDTLRVALAEGNLPRALAASLLPALTYCFLQILTGQGKRRHLLTGALLMLATVLSHAMMAAIFCVCLVLVASIYSLISRQFKNLLAAIACLVLGLMLSSFWLLPSLSGGIGELDQAAVSEALAVFPLTTYLNPLLRLTQPEIVYIGLSITAILMAGLLIKPARSPLLVSFLAVGVMTILISTPGFNAAFNGLPAHHLFWPIRFLSFSVLALAISLAFLLAALRKQKWGLIAIPVLVLVVSLDFWPSVRLLAHTRPPSNEILNTAEVLRRQSGWRQATLDFSRLGSAPSYFFTSQSGREQVFGWAYQSACTATTVSALNGAMETGNWGFVLQLLDILGADDLVLLQTGISLDPLTGLLPGYGYQRVWDESHLVVYHRDGGPRALYLSSPAIGIGSGASNVAALFPGLLLASSPYVDDYDLGYLSQFSVIVLSRFNWHDQSRAEALMVAYAQAGGSVLVDLSAAPEDPLARVPRFLDIYGERVRFFTEPVWLTLDDNRDSLTPFRELPWVAVVPQGDLVESIQFEYHGVSGTALGYVPIGQGKIWFVGLNLPYHTLITHDPLGLEVLSQILPVPAGEPISYATVPLEEYVADQEGYRFTYELATPGELLVPVIGCDGMTIYLDNQPVANHSLYQMVAFTAPAGRHQVRIVFESPMVYYYGGFVSLFGLFGCFIGLLFWQGGIHVNKNKEE